MVFFDSLLSATPEPVKDALDDDTLEYLRELIGEGDETDLDGMREIAEPFLADAGMNSDELDALFSKLNLSTPQSNASATKEEGDGGPKRLSHAQTPAAVKPVDDTLAKLEPRPTAAKQKPLDTSSPLGQPAKKATNPKTKPPRINAYSQQSRFHTETLVTLSKEVDLKDVNVTVDDTELLVDARLWLKTGYRYGFVGRNGVGKSTLLSVIGNKSLVGFPENIRTLYVQQLDVLDTEPTVLDVVLAADTERQRLVDSIESIEHALAHPAELETALNAYIKRCADEKILAAQKTATLRSGRRGKQARVSALKTETNAIAETRNALYRGGRKDSEVAANVLESLYRSFDEMGYQSAEARARAILADLDIPQSQQDQSVSGLSGGWRMRVALAKALYLKPDILLLDECTNHLDLAAIAWLQEYLIGLEGITIVCVSHDRDFLNAVSQEIIRLKDKTLSYHPGNYDEFEMTQDEMRKKRERLQASLDRRREHIEKSIQGFLKHARSTNDQKVLGQVASRKKKLERLGPDKTEDGKKFKISYWAGYHDTMRMEINHERAEKDVDLAIPEPEPLRHNGPLVSLSSVGFSYAESPTRKVLDDVSLSIEMGERVAVLGLNGCGKSTLASIIKRNLLPTTGTVEQHARLRIGHYTQNSVEELTEVTESGVQLLMRKYPAAKEGEIRAWLGSFELSGPIATRPIYMLSGGQRARMTMAIMLFERPHLLLLDEITNHLDMYAIQGLIAAINEFEGSVVLVSHDRHFVREVADDIYSLKDGKLALLDGGVDEYVNSLSL